MIGLQIPLDVSAARFVQPTMQDYLVWLELAHVTSS